MRDESQNEGGKRDDRTFDGGIRDNVSVRTGFTGYSNSEEANFT